MDRRSTIGGFSFTEYTFILGVVLRIVCFSFITTGGIVLSNGLVLTGTTRSNGILILPRKEVFFKEDP